MDQLLNDIEFEERFDVRSWHASSGNIKHVHSAIVSVRAPYDRRYNLKKYIWWDHNTNKYIVEGA